MENVTAQFDISGIFAGAEPIGGGHIHDTFVTRHTRSTSQTATAQTSTTQTSTTQTSTTQTSTTQASDPTIERHIFQRINTDVFRDPSALMENIARICRHLRSELENAGVPDADRRCMRLIETRSGSPLWRDDRGAYWRCFRFQEQTRSLDAVESPSQAYQAARAFAEFIRRLDGLTGPPLTKTIPHFHDLHHRNANLQAAVRADSHGRARSLGAEIEHTAAVYESLTAELSKSDFSQLPERIVHNDCKINNVLLDAETGAGMCVIDLDTSMPGTVLADFGELVRTSACRSPEDETRTESMSIDRDLLQAIAQGFCEGTQSLLTPVEIDVLPLAGPVMAFENGARFLTDHLEGDVYFKIQRPDHNLDRFRAQLRLVELLNLERGFLRGALRRARTASAP